MLPVKLTDGFAMTNSSLSAPSNSNFTVTWRVPAAALSHAASVTLTVTSLPAGIPTAVLLTVTSAKAIAAEPSYVLVMTPPDVTEMPLSPVKTR